MNSTKLLEAISQAKTIDGSRHREGFKITLETDDVLQMNYKAALRGVEMEVWFNDVLIWDSPVTDWFHAAMAEAEDRKFKIRSDYCDEQRERFRDMFSN